MREPPKAGERAPPLRLVGVRGGWDLDEARRDGPQVLCFMPGAFTGTCRREMCTLTERLEDYEGLGGHIVGITVDARPVLAAWAEKESIRIPLLSDFEKQAIRDWGIVWKSSWGTTCKRATFLVDREGIVRYSEVQPDERVGEEPDYERLQAALRSLG